MTGKAQGIPSSRRIFEVSISGIPWIAPGGKIEPGESPHDTARREMREETGLEVESLHARGFCTIVPFLKQYPWFMHVFVTTCFQGRVKAGGRAT